MFDFLDELPIDHVVAALYFGTRIITHRDRVNGTGSIGPYKGIPTEPTEKDAKLGRRIVDELLRQEGCTLQKLSPGAASRIVSQLYLLTNRRISREPGPRPARGKARRLLNQWRRESRKTISSA